MNGPSSAPTKFREACLTCPLFVTTAEFLPQHRKQLDDTRALIGVPRPTATPAWPR